MQNGVLIAGSMRYRLRDFDKIHVIGAGKAAAAMAAKAGRWGKQQGAAFLNVKYGHALPKLRWIEQNECGHPVPDANGVRGAEPEIKASEHPWKGKSWHYHRRAGSIRSSPWWPSSDPSFRPG